MTLAGIQDAAAKALRALPWVREHGVAVLAQDEGNVVFDREAAFAKTHLAAIVGACSFEPASRSAHTPQIAGMARLAVKVLEEPSRNRVGQGRSGPTATEAAEAIACGMHLCRIGGGVLVSAGIGGMERYDETTVMRVAAFEIFTELEGK